VPAAGVLGGAFVLAYLALEFPRQKPFGRGLTLVLMSVGIVALAFVPDPFATTQAALRKAASYAAFFLALGFLRDASETSPLVRRCGLDLVGQPPSRRYAALSLGTHLFAVILSYGAIELMGAMLARTLPEHDDAGRKDAMIGVYRGFSTTTAWSPLNIGMAVILVAVPGTDWTELVPRGFVFAMLALALGAWLRPRLAAPDAPPRIDWAAHAKLCGIVVLVFLAAFAVEEAFAVRLVVGVTAVLPVLAMGWVCVQAKGNAAARGLATWDRLGTVLRLRVPTFRAEAAVLAGAGFAGTALAAAFPAAAMAALLRQAGIGGLPVLLAIPPLMVAMSQVALNPIIAVTVIAAALPDAATLGVTPVAMGMAYLTGWAASGSATPLSASAISTARWAGRKGLEISPFTVTNRWNAGFALAQVGMAWVTLGLLSL
jgi:hypothetical protein